jgi:sugar lactone lactonase YvrE
MVADTLSRWVWSFSVAADGSLVNGVPFYRLEIPDEVESGVLRSNADGMTVDTDGFLYVATNLGIQIVDPAGKTVGILRKPDVSNPSNVVFGGPDLQTLYVTSGEKVFRRTDQEERHVPMDCGYAAKTQALTLALALLVLQGCASQPAPNKYLDNTGRDDVFTAA